MAGSTRKQVLDAAETALSGISGIGSVSQNLRSWDELQPKDFPALFLIDAGAEYERNTFEHATLNDMHCDLTVDVYGYVYSNVRSTASARTALISDVEKALTTNAALLALVQDVMPVSLETDTGAMDKYSIFRFTFNISYGYNHSTP